MTEVDCPLRAYAVEIKFAVEGLSCPDDQHVAVNDFGRRSHPEELEDDEAKIPLLECEAEVALALRPMCDALQRLGCISAGEEGDSSGSLFFVITSSSWEAPRAPQPLGEGRESAMLGRIANHPIKAFPGAALQAWASVDHVELADAHDRLMQLGPTHELSSWGGERTPERLPRDGESAEEWASRVAVPSEYMQSLSDRLVSFDQDLMAFAMPAPSVGSSPDFVIDGLLPLGDTAVLAAPGGVGKSSFCHHLLAVAAAPETQGTTKTFLGRHVPGRFYAALLSAEENDWYFKARQERFADLWPGNLIIRPGDVTRAQLGRHLEQLAQFSARIPDGRRGILVIDSIQAFIGEDDTKAHVASEFHQTLREWAARTGWAVLAIHHTTKVPARSLSTFRGSVRGSSVHVDMPRMVAALIDRGGGIVEFGIVKSNLPPGAAWLREGEGVLCEKRSDTHTFELVSATTELAGQIATGDDLDRIVAAIGELNSIPRTVQRTGSDGLYEQRLPRLAGLSRRFVQQAISSLVSAGRIEVTRQGLMLKDAIEAQQPAG